MIPPKEMVYMAMPELVIPLTLTCRASTIIEAPNPDVDSGAFDGVRGLCKTVYPAET
jgi:hypothetical protein